MPNHTPHHLNPRSPLVLDTRDLPRRPGAVRAVERTVPAPSDLGLELIGVPGGTELSFHLQIESISEGVYVSGTVTVAVEGECGRCLRPISKSIDVSIQELYVSEDSVQEETEDDDEDEVGRLQGDLIDLEMALRDAVVLALPTNPLCRLNCPGLCPDCGVPFDELPGDHSHDLADPRWAALSKLKTSEE